MNTKIGRDIDEHFWLLKLVELIQKSCDKCTFSLNFQKSETQQAVLALVNALIQKSEPQKKKYWCTALTSRQYRTILSNNIVLQHGEVGIRQSVLSPYHGTQG